MPQINRYKPIAQRINLGQTKINNPAIIAKIAEICNVNTAINC